MFGSLLNSFAPQQSQWHVDLPGFSNEKASHTYGQCILAGGNDSECAGKGFEAGSGGNAKIVGTEDNQSFLDKTINVLAKLSPFVTKGERDSYNASKEKIQNISVPRIATGIIGIVLVGGAMFMFGVASFTPVGKIVEAVKGAE